MNEDLFKDRELLDQIKTLTLERLKVMPENTDLVIGSDPYSKEELINHVANADELGKKIMEIQLEFLQDLASGEIYKDDNPHHSAQT